MGLGRAFTLMLPTLSRHPHVRLVAAYDPRPDARDRFAADFKAASHDNPQSLCADPGVQAVYIASPHQFHAEHVELAARHGKHILVEKPMALSMADGLAMVASAREHNVQLLVGHSHSYDLPYLRAREIISSGSVGDVRMITALNFTDFLYRPRRPEELDTRLGGGVIFSQGSHQIDVVRLLAGSRAVAVRAVIGAWDETRPTEGAYTAQIRFANGAFASLTYSGYGRFDTDEFNGWTGELGQKRDPSGYGSARRLLGQATSPIEEIKLKERRAYGPSGVDAFQGSTADLSHNHFGLVVVSCQRADLRPTPDGILVYDDTERRLEPLDPPTIPRAEVIDELWSAVAEDKPPLHSGDWGLATLEICLALLRSANNDETVILRHQI
jgi:phthalate 4,5-cis-dihydrodiol dehydrogenase